MSLSEWDDDFDDIDNDDLDDDDLDDWPDAASPGCNNTPEMRQAPRRRGCFWWCLIGWWWLPIKWVFIGMAYLYFILPYRFIKWMIKCAGQLVRKIKDKPYE